MEIFIIFHLLLSARVVRFLLAQHLSIFHLLKMTKAKQYAQFVLYANYVDHEVMNETVEEKIGYTGLLGKVSSIPSYRGNRFNNLLAGAVGVISHFDDIQTFINDHVENPNAKSEVSYMTCKTIV